MNNRITKRSAQSGHRLVELGLALSLIVIFSVLIMKAGGRQVAGTFDNIQRQMKSQGVVSTISNTTAQGARAVSKQAVGSLDKVQRRLEQQGVTSTSPTAVSP